MVQILLSLSVLTWLYSCEVEVDEKTDSDTETQTTEAEEAKVPTAKPIERNTNPIILSLTELAYYHGESTDVLAKIESSNLSSPISKSEVDTYLDLYQLLDLLSELRSEQTLAAYLKQRLPDVDIYLDEILNLVGGQFPIETLPKENKKKDAEAQAEIQKNIDELRDENNEDTSSDSKPNPAAIELPGMRPFGSKGCGVNFEASSSCEDFAQLKSCLRDESAKNCEDGKVVEIKCTDLNSLTLSQRYRCLSKLNLQENHPLFQERNGQWDEALCSDPKGRITLDGSSGQPSKYSSFKIGYWHCERPKTKPPKHTVACEVVNSSDDVIWCGEVSSRFPGVIEAIMSKDNCANGYSKAAPRKGLCPKEDLWFGCRKFLDSDNHEGVFFYSRSDNKDQDEFYKEYLNCLNPNKRLRINLPISAMGRFGPGNTGPNAEYIPPKATGDWILP